MRVSGAQGNRRAEPAVRTVRTGDLSADLIQRAGAAGQTLAITHDRELVGIVVPVTQGLVEFLIEQNVSRVLYSISLSEKQLTTADQMTPLDQVMDQPDSGWQAPGAHGVRQANDAAASSGRGDG